MRRRSRLLAMLAMAVAAVVVFAACDPAPPPPPSPLSPAASDLVARHNSYRSTAGEQTLVVDGGATANAQFHADRLAAGATSCTNSLWHSGEMGAWYGGYAYGENVACVSGCPNDAAIVWNLWMGSPGHEANVTNPAYGVIGVGVSCNGAVEMVVAHYRSP